MSYIYSAFVSINDANGRSKNFTLAPTITVWDGDDESQILSPSPTLVYFETGLYKVKVTLSTKTDVLFKIVPHVDDQEEIADIKLIHEKVVHVAEDILEDTGTTLPGVLDAIKGTGWTDENLVAIKAAIDAVNEGKITAQEVWEYAARTLTQSATEVVAAVTGSSITQVRGNTWSFEVPGLTLHAHRQQFAIKRSLEDSDDQALLLIDSQSKLVRVMGRAAQDPSGASLSYAGTSLTVGAAAEISARLPAGRWKFGIQSIAEDGTVAENKIGDFILEADAVRATE